MASIVTNQGLTTSFPGGSVTHLSPPANQQPDPRAPLFQIPLGFLQSTANNYGSMAGGLSGIGQAMGNLGSSQANALSGLANAYANNFGSYGNTLGSLGQAAASEATGLYGAMSGAAQANQAGLGNMWTQAMASLGGMGNNIAQSMAQGQVGYQNALASMQNANQEAMGQFGSSRLDNIGRLGAADAVSNIDLSFGFGDGSGGGGPNAFQATGPGGEIASGSIGGSPGGGGFSGGGSASRSGADMSPYLAALNDDGVLDRLMAADLQAQERLDNQQSLYRKDYGSLFGSGLSGLLEMGRQGSESMRTGMQDLYSNMASNRTNFGDYLSAAREGFGRSSDDIGSVGDRMSRDYGSGMQALGGLASQINTGMTGANDTAMDFTREMLGRFMPSAMDQYKEGRELRDLQAADAASQASRSPYSAQNTMNRLQSLYQQALRMSPQRASSMARDMAYGRAAPRPFGPQQLAALQRYYRQS